MNNELGILGLGNRSTLFYLNQINKNYNSLNGGYSTCPYLLLNTNFDCINPYLPNQFEKLIPIVKSYIQKLVNIGAKNILIPNITLHETIDKITEFNKDLFVHPITILSNELKKEKLKKSIILLGTLHTMNNSYFINHINKEGYQTTSLNSNDSQFIDEFRTSIYNDNETDVSKLEFDLLIDRLSLNNIIIVACTELSIYFNSSNKNVINLPLLQVNEFVSLALNKA